MSLKPLTRSAEVNKHSMTTDVSVSALGSPLGFQTSNRTSHIDQNIAFAMGHFLVLSVMSRKIILLLGTFSIAYY